MMKLKKLAISLALAGSAATASAAVITNADGVFDFGGFDWASNGSVYIQGYDIVSGLAAGTTDTFTLSYQAFAANLQDSAGNNLVLPGLNVGYEYTINATITEQVTCVNAGCTIVTIDVVGGTWDVFTGAANATVGAAGLSGYLDGTNILSGTFSGGGTIIGAQGASNPGNITLAGTFVGAVTMTDLAVITPELTGTEAVSTLQFGANTTAWTRPTNWDGMGALAADTNTNFVGQADANQSFSVPEPGSLALLGLGLGFAGMFRRRASK